MSCNDNKAEILSHPADPWFHPWVFPSVWCPGCGIGIAVFALLDAIKQSDLLFDRIHFISGTGCTSKAGEYLKLKNSRVKDGKILQKIRQNRRQGKAGISIALMNNPDLLLSGGEDFQKEKSGKETGVIIFVNNLIYSVNNRHLFPMTPFCRKSVDGRHDLPFNLPALAKQAGVKFIARWTPLQAGWLRYSLSHALKKPGFSLIEVVSPCVVFNVENGRILDAPERMVFYNQYSCFFSGEKISGLDLRQDRIVIGELANR